MLQSALVVLLVRRWAPGVLGAGGLGSIHSVRVLARGSAAVLVGCLAGAVMGSFVLWLAHGEVTWLDAALWFGRQFGGVMIVSSVGHLTWERLVQPEQVRRSSASRAERLALWLASGLVYGAVFLLPLPFAYAAVPCRSGAPSASPPTRPPCTRRRSARSPCR